MFQVQPVFLYHKSSVKKAMCSLWDCHGTTNRRITLAIRKLKEKTYSLLIPLLPSRKEKIVVEKQKTDKG